MNTHSTKPMGHSKAVLRGKFIAIQAYLKKIEIFQMNNLTNIYTNWRNYNKQNPERIEGRK